MKVFKCLVLLGLTGCGSDIPLPDMVCEDGSVCDVNDSNVPIKMEPITILPEVKSDPFFSPWIQLLQKKAMDVGRYIDLTNVPITFGETASRGSHVVAYCIAKNNGQRVVYVNQSFFAAASANQQLLILTHEIGHCSVTLNRAHRQEYRGSDWTPISIMYSYLLKESAYLAHQDEYWDEFFNHPMPQLSWGNSNQERVAEIIMPVDDEDNDVPIFADHTHENGTDCSLNVGEYPADKAVKSNSSGNDFPELD